MRPCGPWAGRRTQLQLSGEIIITRYMLPRFVLNPKAGNARVHAGKVHHPRGTGTICKWSRVHDDWSSALSASSYFIHVRQFKGTNP